MSERFGKVDVKVFEDSALHPHVKLVYAVLAGHADSNRRAFPTRETLVRLTGLSRASVTRALAEARRAGLITSVRTGGASRYQIHDSWASRPYIPGAVYETVDNSVDNSVRKDSGRIPKGSGVCPSVTPEGSQEAIEGSSVALRRIAESHITRPTNKTNEQKNIATAPPSPRARFGVIAANVVSADFRTPRRRDEPVDVADVRSFIFWSSVQTEAS